MKRDLLFSGGFVEEDRDIPLGLTMSNSGLEIMFSSGSAKTPFYKEPVLLSEQILLILL